MGCLAPLISGSARHTSARGMPRVWRDCIGGDADWQQTSTTTVNDTSVGGSWCSGVPDIFAKNASATDDLTLMVFQCVQ